MADKGRQLIAGPAQRSAATQGQAARAKEASQRAAELEFGQLVREVAGDRYPTLVAAVSPRTRAGGACRRPWPWP